MDIFGTNQKEQTLKDQIKLLTNFFELTDGGNWTNKQNWGTSSPPTEWFGITITNGKISEISLPSNNLSGHLTESLFKISTLIKIDLSDNKLTGEIPKLISSLIELRTLDLSNNLIYGTIPDLSRCYNLDTLNLKTNKITGDIPVSLAKCYNLRLLHLGENSLTGNIPENITSMKHLTVINFQKNFLTGKIPETIGLLFCLETLNLENNKLTGEIPANIATMTKLKHLILRNNMLTGPIPERLEVLLNLDVLYLNNNQLSGAIPRKLGNLHKCHFINLAFNNLSGTIPDSFNHMDILSIKEFNLSNNKLYGEISVGLVDFVLQARKNNLSYIIDLSKNPQGFHLSNDITTLVGLYAHIDLSNMSLIGTISEHLIRFFSSSSVNLSDNYMQGELSIHAVRYISNSREKGIQIDLHGNLGFWLPADLGKLGDELNVLNLKNCSLIKSIPQSIDSFAQGSLINLSNNSLSGELPIGIIRLASVIYSNSIFDSLATLCNALVINYSEKKVYLENNKGFTLPNDFREIGDRIEALNLSNSSLTGSLPDSLAHITTAKSIDFQDNSFSGNLSLPVISFISSLRQRGGSFKLKQTQGLYLPLNLGNIVPNQYIDLSDCCLEGGFPQSVSMLNQLKYINLENNSLVGEIPIGFVKIIIHMRRDGKDVKLMNSGKFTLPLNLTSLSIGFGSDSNVFKKIDLSYCNLTGSIPASICSLRSIGVFELDFTGNNFTGNLPLSLSRLKNLLAISYSFDGVDGTKVDYATLVRYLLRDIAIGIYNDSKQILEEEIISDPEKNLWKAIISSNLIALEGKVRQLVGKFLGSLTEAVDLEGTRCIEAATPSMQLAVLSGTFYCGRYQIANMTPIYKSENTIIIEAIDRGYELKLRNYFCNNLMEKTYLTNEDVISALVSINLIDGSNTQLTKSIPNSDYLKATSHNFISACKHFIFSNFEANLVPKVAIKFCKSNEYFVRDWMVRSTNEFDEKYVIDIIKDDDPRSLVEAIDYYEDFKVGISTEYNHVMILQKSGINLSTFLAQENPDIARKTKLCGLIAESLYHIHQKGVMHGDVRGTNIICSAGDDLVAENASFIDFTNSGRFLPSSNGNATFVGEYFGSRFNSHMNLPPEFYHKLSGKDEKMFLNYQTKSKNKFSDLTIRGKKGVFVPKIFDIEAVNMDGSVIPRDPSDLPYKLLLASPLIDIWSFGVLLLVTLCDGKKLISEALVTNRDLEMSIAVWSDANIQTYIIKKIKDPVLKDLISGCLQVDPSKRIKSVERILSHPFFGLTVDPNSSNAFNLHQSNLNLYTIIDKKRKKANEEKLVVNNIPESKISRIRNTEGILRKAVFDSEFDFLTPTCFVILNRRFNELISTHNDPSIHKAILWSKKLAQLTLSLNELGQLQYYFDADNQIGVPVSDNKASIDFLNLKLNNINLAISNLFNEESDFWLYLLDEASLKILPENPIRITPTEFIPRILPLFQLTLRAVANIRGIEGIADVLRVPYQNHEGSLFVDSSVLDIVRCFDSSNDSNMLIREYDLLIKSGTPASQAVHDPWKARMNPLIELDHLYAKCDLDFNGLRKVIVAGSCVCWTKESLDQMSSDDNCNVSEPIVGSISIAAINNNQVSTDDSKLNDNSFYENENPKEENREETFETAEDRAIFRKILNKGLGLKMHSNKNKPPREVVLYLNDNNLSWKVAGKVFALTPKSIDIKNIHTVEWGKKTTAFDKAEEVPEDFCFSLISESRTLDFECSNILERDSVAQSFVSLLNSQYEDDPVKSNPIVTTSKEGKEGEVKLTSQPNDTNPIPTNKGQKFTSQSQSKSSSTPPKSTNKPQPTQSSAPSSILTKTDETLNKNNYQSNRPETLPTNKDKTPFISLPSGPSNLNKPVDTSNKFEKIPLELLTYLCEYDEKGTSGKQSISNLSNDGTQYWNKWFTGQGHPPIREATITVKFSSPQPVHRYLLASANDCPYRNPKSWALWAQKPNYPENIWDLLHEVPSESFTDFWQEKAYDLAPDNTLYSSVQLRLATPGDGIQLGKFMLYLKSGIVIPSYETSEESKFEIKKNNINDDYPQKKPIGMMPTPNDPINTKSALPPSSSSTSSPLEPLSTEPETSKPLYPESPTSEKKPGAFSPRVKSSKSSKSSKPAESTLSPPVPVETFFSWTKKARDARKKYLESDPLSHKYLEEYASNIPDITDDANQSGKYLNYVKLPYQELTYICEHDEKGTNGKQSVSNLYNDGKEPWNKWYSGKGKPPIQQTKITVKFSSPQPVHKYLLASANDCNHRNPKSWELWGQRPNSPENTWDLLHEVPSESFTDFWQEKTYDLTGDKSSFNLKQSQDNLFSSIQLRISKVAMPGDGIQLGKFILFKKQNNNQ